MTTRVAVPDTHRTTCPERERLPAIARIVHVSRGEHGAVWLEAEEKDIADRYSAAGPAERALIDGLRATLPPGAMLAALKHFTAAYEGLCQRSDEFTRVLPTFEHYAALIEIAA